MGWRDLGGPDGGLPAGSAILAFAADARTPGLLWASRDGGGIYRSEDGGQHWRNVGIGVGENVALALAVDYTAPDAVLIGTATAGVWALRPGSQPQPSPQSADAGASRQTGSRGGVDARIEVVWPHDFAPVTEAKLANIGLRLFVPGSLETSGLWLAARRSSCGRPSIPNPPSASARPGNVTWMASRSRIGK